MMKELNIFNIDLKLLPQKAIYVGRSNSLLVSDIHLGKSETFQRSGIPIPSNVNDQTLDRLYQLCSHFKPDNLFILGDLFHSKFALVSEVLEGWSNFLKNVKVDVTLIIGNHDRPFAEQLMPLATHCYTDAVHIDNLILSHEPCSQPNHLNICGHIHPCLKIKTRLDSVRLPCFYLDTSNYSLVLPSFGEFTGGHEVELTATSVAYAIADDTIISFEGS